MNVFPDKKIAKLNGLLQTFTGLGMLLGPILGSFLFKLGGFKLPFFTVGVLLLCLAIVFISLLWKTQTRMNASQE
jgi:MFS family permease